MRSRTLPPRTRLSRKQARELLWWRGEKPKFVPWYEGELDELWGVPPPADEEKITRFDAFRNAVLTFVAADSENYPRRLRLARDHFEGTRILDVGCGAIPYVLAFSGCEAVGVDPLVDEYRRLGFPLDGYSERLRYLNAPAERIPVPASFFDAVVSVNAIDHVDDFPAVAREISRVLRPGGILRFEAHYHGPSGLEPWRLTDELVTRHLGHLGIRKVHERRVEEQEKIHSLDEILVVWATD